MSITRPHTTDFDSDVDFRTGCGNANHYQRLTFLDLHYINANNLHSLIHLMNASSKIDKFSVITFGVILLLQVAHNL